VPRTFKQFCAQCQQTSVYHLNLMVYGHNSKNRRTGTLKRRERLVWEGDHRALLINDAKSGTGMPYARSVHGGRRGMSAPTKNFRMAFAWMWNRAAHRPGPDDAKGWRRAVKAGRAVVTKQVGPSAAKPWRERMIDDMMGKWTRMWSQRQMEIMKE
jgi:hypothetical protein